MPQKNTDHVPPEIQLYIGEGAGDTIYWTRTPSRTYAGARRSASKNKASARSTLYVGATSTAGGDPAVLFEKKPGRHWREVF